MFEILFLADEAFAGWLSREADPAHDVSLFRQIGHR
jgi:hypothetical protein